MVSPLYLLDTHALLWATSDPSRLSPAARQVLENDKTRIFVSTASLWELSIKQGLGKVQLPEAFFESIYALGFERLGMEDHHLAEYRNLPLIHRDPFDRLLVAQARVEQLHLLSCDKEIMQYDVKTVWI